jgi:hypothetical protein
MSPASQHDRGGDCSIYRSAFARVGGDLSGLERGGGSGIIFIVLRAVQYDSSDLIFVCGVALVSVVAFGGGVGHVPIGR